MHLNCLLDMLCECFLLSSVTAKASQAGSGIIVVLVLVDGLD
jgi:hypothetical protein